ncbi:MAG: L-aspartate oxidase [Acidimicrobiia bacterium]|nr:L-aspartate oxidase [Acidimicrobiia bacterium]
MSADAAHHPAAAPLPAGPWHQAAPAAGSLAERAMLAGRVVDVVRVPLVVVGAGVAGLSVALEAGRGLVICDAPLGEGGSSPWAQGGLAAAVGESDRGASHAADTIAAGAGLVAPEVAQLVTSEAPDVVAWLEGLGVRWDRTADGRLDLHREAAHGAARIVHHRDATGAELVRALGQQVRSRSAVTVCDRTVAVDLIRGPAGAGGRAPVLGVLARDLRRDRLVAYLAGAVVLASGGYGHLWEATTTPAQVVGDGIALAARAGAALADLEFVQFHPTALDVAADPRPLLTEALRGAGAHLVDESGTRFCLVADPAGELAPRDVVARAIYRHQASGHRTYLDATGVCQGSFAEHFPTVAMLCAAHGLDPARDRLPVTPASHYCMGGVAVDRDGATSLPGLWAVGEVAATGLHGANRLASNSLLEGIVLGRRLGAALRALAEDDPPCGDRPESLFVDRDAAWLDESGGADIVAATRRILWEGAGVERSAAGLEAAGRELATLASASVGGPRSRRAANALLVASSVIASALARDESRGAHTRSDHPGCDPARGRRRLVRPVPTPTVELVCASEVVAA